MEIPLCYTLLEFKEISHGCLKRQFSEMSQQKSCWL